MPPPLRKWRRGDPLAAQRLNAMQENSLARLRSGMGIAIWRAGQHVVVGIRPGLLKWLMSRANMRLSDDTPGAVGAAGSAGTSEEAARSDHLHEGIVPGGVVESLPGIPAVGIKIVIWTSEGDGDGDDQAWMACAGQSKWTPMQKTTSLSGIP